jgi:hypothetical protein
MPGGDKLDRRVAQLRVILTVVALIVAAIVYLMTRS